MGGFDWLGTDLTRGMHQQRHWLQRFAHQGTTGLTMNLAGMTGSGFLTFLDQARYRKLSFRIMFRIKPTWLTVDSVSWLHEDTHGL